MSVRPEEMLRTKAIAAAGVTNLIGSGSSARWYPNMAPQLVKYPCVVLGVASDAPQRHLTGYSGWTIARVSLGLYALTYEAVQALAEQLRLALSQSGGSGTVGVETVSVGVIRLESQEDSPVEPTAGEDKPIYGITQNYLVSMAQATS